MKQEINRLDLPSFLAAQSLSPKFYWKSRKTGEERVAFGCLKEYSNTNLPSFSDEPLYGVLSFSSSPYFFLPQVEILQTKEKTILHLKKQSEINWDFPLVPLPVPLENRIDTPSLSQWEHTVKEILRKIQMQTIRKAVLARKSTFSSRSPPFSWLRQLIETASLNATVFAFQKKDSSLFLGASPEMLYERKEQQLETESIAGTRKRGISPLEDLLLSQELQMSAKDREEIHCIQLFLQEKLSTLCTSFSMTPPSLLQTTHVQHLWSQCKGLLKEGVKDMDLLMHLHPTPAVAGLPQKQALEQILSLEPFDRNLYAGAIGWFSLQEAAFAVGIRSACIEGNQLHAFAGAGIVGQSHPQKEWEELNSKLSHWIHHDIPRTF